MVQAKKFYNAHEIMVNNEFTIDRLPNDSEAKQVDNTPHSCYSFTFNDNSELHLIGTQVYIFYPES